MESIKVNNNYNFAIIVTGCPVKPITEMVIDDYNKAFDLDVRTFVSIITIVVVKAAVENFTKVWAIELAQYNIRVNAIAPGAINTDIWNVPGLTEEESKAHMEKTTAAIPLKRVGSSEDIGACALFLVSDDASYVTGSVYAVDGGMGA